MSEIESLRPALLNALLTTPHRELSKLYPLHIQTANQDPLFYMKLAAWNAKHGAVRDHAEVFVAVLVLSQFAGHRDVGLALLRELPPYQVARVVDFIKGDSRKRRVLRPGQQPIKHVRGEKLKVTAEMIAERYEEKVEQVGLFKSLPTALRTELRRYLRERERNPEGFDSAVLTARKALKRLYAGLRIQPSERAKQILFFDRPPDGSVLRQLKLLAKATTAEEAATILSEYRIPYRVAISNIKQFTPALLAAVIGSMTPSEVLGNLAALKERGVLDNADLKTLVDTKLEAAKFDRRVSAMKGQRAAQSADFDAETTEKLEAVTQSRVEARGTITRSLALLVDKSTSQESGIKAGMQLAALVAGICKAPLYVYAFDVVAYPLKAAGSDIKDWEAVFAGIHAHGNTSIGFPIEWMRQQKQRVEQFVIVTDEAENTRPSFHDAYKAYAETMGIQPDVTLLRVGKEAATCRLIQDACNRLGVTCNPVEFNGDYFSLPNVIPHLTHRSQSDMVMEILMFPLPKRRSA